MNLVPFVVLLTAVTAAHAKSTTYTLLNKNVVRVSESMVTCKNGHTTSVTTGVEGELHELSTTRTNFAGVKWRRRMALLDREPDDEQGHVVASVFGGPVETWNLVPQHRSVNRRVNMQGGLWQLNRWDEFEKWTRQRLRKEGGPVKFRIGIRYASRYGCRPVGFDVEASSGSEQVFRGSVDNGPYWFSRKPSKRQRNGPSKRRKNHLGGHRPHRKSHT